MNVSNFYDVVIVVSSSENCQVILVAKNVYFF